MAANSFKLFHATHGGLGVLNAVPAWIGPKLELSYVLSGSKGDVVVNVIASKKYMKSTIDYLSVELKSSTASLSSTGKRILLIGDHSQWKLATSKEIEKFVSIQL